MFAKAKMRAKKKFQKKLNHAKMTTGSPNLIMVVHAKMTIASPLFLNH